MLVYELRQSLRTLLQRPGLSLAILLILALGIGATTTFFSIVSSVLFAPLPYKEGDRLVALRTMIEKERLAFPASYLDVESWREQSRTLQGISAASSGQELNMTGGDRAERVGVGYVSASYFDLLGVRPWMGRGFSPAEDSPGDPAAVTVLSHSLWKRRFGADRSIVGKKIQLHGREFQVLGVLPANFKDIYPNVDLYVPVTQSRITQRAGYIEDRAVRWLDVFARLRPGSARQQAQQEMLAISRQLAAEYPSSNAGYVLDVLPLRTSQIDFERTRLSFLTLLIGALFVLLVGCANVMNLLLVRAVERRKELALRLAMGGSPSRLVRHFVLEAGILCAAGCLLGIAAAYLAVDVLARLGPVAYDLPAFVQLAVDGRALAVAVGLAMLISLLIGVIPARRALLLSPQEELKSESRGYSPSASTAFTRNFLVASAISFSVVLLIGAGLMLKSLEALTQSDPGFRIERTVSARFELPATQYTEDAPVYLLYRQILDKAKALPGVENAGIWAPGMLGASAFYKFIVPEGRSLEAPEDQVKVYEHRVSPGLLQAAGITVLQGRGFTWRDNADTPLVAILSRSAAAAAWPGQSAVGKRFWTGPPQDAWAEVVGVAKDVYQRGRLQADHEFQRDVYFPLFQMRARKASLLLQVSPGLEPAGLHLEEILRSVDPGVPVYDVKTLAARRREEETGARLNTALLIVFAVSALALAVVGIYSILAYTVRQQSYEIGIRMALGADRADILRQFAGRGLTLLAIGLAAGLTGAFLLAKTISAILFNVSPFDPAVFAAVAAVISLFSLPAILGPARKATKKSPSVLS